MLCSTMNYCNIVLNNLNKAAILVHSVAWKIPVCMKWIARSPNPRKRFIFAQDFVPLPSPTLSHHAQRSVHIVRHKNLSVFRILPQSLLVLPPLGSTSLKSLAIMPQINVRQEWFVLDIYQPEKLTLSIRVLSVWRFLQWNGMKCHLLLDFVDVFTRVLVSLP